MGKLLLFISLGLSSASAFAAAEGVSSTALFFPEESWGFRLESEFKSTYDKQKKVDGYESQTDVKAYRALSPDWSLSLGGRINQADRNDSRKSSPARLDEGAAGVRTVFSLVETKIRTDLTYNSILTDEIRREGHDGYFLAEFRSHLLWSSWGKMRLRLKHWEYTLNRIAADIELRQTKFEFSPGAYVAPKVWLGLKNQIIHCAYAHDQDNTYEIGPTVRYEGRHLEPLAKIIYRPVKDSPEFRLADNWSREPIYSIEIDLKF